ncbi:hypothetical protein L202_03306 [Cryptococcus amylolentus CBS 6039]|uniref:Uncharacterized protein n=1 Tax=Cryptococcus amylolentus CBS 6039 TaxID=1295533 RepID=A0A1E3HSH1_9TREE|nr:hypothetical protein L202_03306 [Cryptococcus amylolentus CBS 6039]ODN79294.1 hypothetical protein L202_03306 [Cryptococcus amylolentus CBS 6039]
MGPLDSVTAHLPTVLRNLPPLYKASATFLALAFATYLWLFPIANARIPFRNLPDPGPGHWLLGHVIPVLFGPSPNSANIDFHKTLGHTIKYRTQLGSYEVSTIDPTAISYVLNHHHIFVPPPLGAPVAGKQIGSWSHYGYGGRSQASEKTLGSVL